MLWDRYPVCRSVCHVTLVYCGQTALGTTVGLGPGHIVLDGDQLPHGKGHSSPPLSRFTDEGINRGPCLLWLNGRPSQQLLSSC